MDENRPIGVLLLNLGGPDSPAAVRPFLYNLFSDRMIIRLGPAFLQKPIARMISAARASKAINAYGLIGGGSPLNELSLAQARALESALGGGFRTFVGMRYWHPFIREALEQARSAGINKLIVLSLYPHYSLATTGSSLHKLTEDLKSFDMQTGVIEPWFRHPLYIEALAENIRKGMASFERDNKEIFVLFSAHGLPVKIAGMGDPYVEHVKGTIEAVREKVEMEYALSYQSRTGPVKWIGPYTDEMLKELARNGVKNVLMVPVSFVSDHIETLYEIDILYKRLADGLGINLRRTGALNTHPKLIGAFADLVLGRKKELGW
ncbi:MAG: ferrochelatase [Nitrospiraceae bacterium]|nr:ferrochelatase [Nitrospiraceae bacterium]